eukprot:12908433-Prorocentrum_lima.AAC.1
MQVFPLSALAHHASSASTIGERRIGIGSVLGIESLRPAPTPGAQVARLVAGLPHYHASFQ